METRFIAGFSKLSREQKLKLITERLSGDTGLLNELNALNHNDPEIQERLANFSENTLGNFPLPYGVAPNFLVNGKFYTVPMVTEESSVVAAASSAAVFWAGRGGFHATVKGMTKTGQIHFCFYREKAELFAKLDTLKNFLLERIRHTTRNMVERGGGIRNIELIDHTARLNNYYQLLVSFGTGDSMGANFINSVLEEMGGLLTEFFGGGPEGIEVIMAILSNHTPECLVECYVETSLDSFGGIAEGFSGEQFARKFKKAADIASFDIYRAVTHNKGIFNGIDAVVIATANDFRAVEAAGHAWASRNGRYSSLSKVGITGNTFRMSLELPLSVGTVGGLTRLHPLAAWSYKILGEPDASELMMIIASAGLANNFSALRSLVTVGIQKGHMKMHLNNILSFLGASNEETRKAGDHFSDRKVSYSDVEDFLKMTRGKV
jgi:hydroxymethylglutaryl-CoA reductase